MSNLHLNDTLVAQWPEELRPEDPSSVELVSGEDFAMTMAMGPYATAELGENRHFVMSLGTLKAQIIHSEKEEDWIYDADATIVLPAYEVSHEVLLSLDNEASETMKVEDPEKHARITAEKTAEEQAATS